MKKLILIAFVLFGFSINHGYSQSKKESVTTLDTDSPWFEFIYKGESPENTGVRIMVQDRQRQYTAMNYARMKAESKSDDPLNYFVKLIHMPEVNPLAFRQVESLEENAMPEDGITILVVRFKDLQEAALIWYQ